MYEEIKTIKGINEKIKSLNIQQMTLQNQMASVSNREMDRLEETIELYDRYIEDAKKRKEVIEKEQKNRE